jgi:cell division transport system permease protein
MSRVRLLFSEAWSSISQNISTTFAATMTVLIGMFLLGLFIALGTWVLSWSDHVKKELTVKVFFAGTATDAQEYAVRQQLAKDHTRVKKIVFVSKEQAERTMAKKFPALYATPLPSNPLPDSWVITPMKGEYTEALGQEITKAKYAGVDDVRWGSKTAHRVLVIAEVIWIVFLVAVILLVTASTLLIANTIRLSIFARRREVEVMKLVGATNWFIRWPFVIEGMIVGFLGGLLAVLLLGIVKATFLDPLADRFALLAAPDTIDFKLLAVLLMFACIAVSALGSGITLRRFLRV